MVCVFTTVKYLGEKPKNLGKEKRKSSNPNQRFCLFKNHYRSFKKLSIKPGNEVISVDIKKENHYKFMDLTMCFH